MAKRDYSLRTKWGDALYDDGFTSVPNAFLKHYVEIGIDDDGPAMFVIHLMCFQWTSDDPYPARHSIPMAATDDTMAGYAKYLRQRALLFTRRHYDKGHCVCLEYDLNVILENLRRVLQERPGVIIPWSVVEGQVSGSYHDTPKTVADFCQEAYSQWQALPPGKQGVDGVIHTPRKTGTMEFSYPSKNIPTPGIIPPEKQGVYKKTHIEKDTNISDFSAPCPHCQVTVAGKPRGGGCPSCGASLLSDGAGGYTVDLAEGIFLAFRDARGKTGKPTRAERADAMSHCKELHEAGYTAAQVGAFTYAVAGQEWTQRFPTWGLAYVCKHISEGIPKSPNGSNGNGKPKIDASQKIADDFARQLAEAEAGNRKG